MSRIVSIIVKLYRSISYLLFRYFYTLNHLSIFCLIKLFRKIICKKKSANPESKKYIIICGAELNNKGSQGRIFTFIKMVMDRYPDKEPVLFGQSEISQSLKGDYCFKIVDWNYHSRARLLSKVNRLFFKKLPVEKEIHSIASNAMAMVDLGSFQLSSRRGTGWSANFFSNGIFAAKYRIAFYMFPQIIGPFNYPLNIRLNFKLLLRFVLPDIKKIYSLDNNGLSYLKKYTRKNIEKSVDIGLLYPLPDFPHIFKKEILKEKSKPPVEIDEKNLSVALIPSAEIMFHKGEDFLIKLYEEIIHCLTSHRINVYLISYGTEEKPTTMMGNPIPYSDLEICKRIGENFKENDFVITIEKDLNLLQLEELTKRFSFTIGSRYCGLISSFKNSIPSIFIGWPTKAQQLMDDLKQEKFYFNIDSHLHRSEIVESLNHMIKNFHQQGDIIKEQVEKLKEQYRVNF